MVGSDQEAESSIGKKMASRLKLRKRKYHPPLQESPNLPHIEYNKTTEEMMKNETKTNGQITDSAAQIKTTEKPKKTYIKTYAQATSSSTLDFDENEIFSKAKESAKKHRINLKAGRKDRGYGNCAFEGVINNINDRTCFSDKLVQSPNWYTVNWMHQMMERLLMETCPWNPGYTSQQIREGFAQLQESGIYEIDFFGDMIMGGIACGTRKRILIFNTSENLLHDPISVVDPKFYDERIRIDNETPVVVAYNNYHYENLHPVDEEDRIETMRLVDSYIKDRYNEEYGFTKKDIRYLVSPSPRFAEKASSTREIYHQHCQRKQIDLDSQEKLKVESNLNCFNPDKPEKQNKESKIESGGLQEQGKQKQPWSTVLREQNQKRKKHHIKLKKKQPINQK